MTSKRKRASRLHQTLVEMIRDKPPFTLALAEVGGATFPAGATATSIGEALAPVRDFLPDAAIAIHDARGVLDRIVLVEVQLARDPRKALTMPVYQALARARHEAPCEVMVVTPARRVAAWLAQPIELGGGSRFCARVVGPQELLRLRAARSARVDITVEVAFLRAIAHGEREPRLVATAGFVFDAMLPLERAARYFDVILDALPMSKRRALESFMEKEHLQLQSWYFKKLARKATAEGRSKGLAEGRSKGLAEGRSKGLAEGRSKGLAEGRVEGQAEGLRSAIRALIEVRGMRLSTAQSRELDRCADLALLDDWVKRAAQAHTVDEIFSPPAKRSTRARASRRADAGPASGVASGRASRTERTERTGGRARAAARSR